MLVVIIRIALVDFFLGGVLGWGRQDDRVLGRPLPRGQNVSSERRLMAPAQPAADKAMARLLPLPRSGSLEAVSTAQGALAPALTVLLRSTIHLRVGSPLSRRLHPRPWPPLRM